MIQQPSPVPAPIQALGDPAATVCAEAEISLPMVETITNIVINRSKQ